MSRNLFRILLIDGLLSGLAAGCGICAFVNDSGGEMLVALIAFILWIPVQFIESHLYNKENIDC